MNSEESYLLDQIESTTLVLKNQSSQICAQLTAQPKLTLASSFAENTHHEMKSISSDAIIAARPNLCAISNCCLYVVICIEVIMLFFLVQFGMS